MSCSCLGTELGLLFFSSSVQFIQLVYLKKEKGKKKRGWEICLLSVFYISLCALMLLPKDQGWTQHQDL